MKESTIYSKWLRKELTQEEKAQLYASGDLEILEKIIAETDTWTLPNIKENSFGQLQEKIYSKRFKKNKVTLINLFNYRTYGIAASLALIVLSVYLIFFFDTTLTYQCQAGQQLKVTLPDKTSVVLNGLTSISIDEKTYIENREVHLSGQAYFEVFQKGNFTVTFSQGKVQVLGTKFNILSGDSIATVKCYEGKVKATDNTNNKEEILTAGQGVRLNKGTVNSFEFTSEGPEWISGQSIFKEAPLAEVINELSIQYNIKFESTKVNLQRDYTGKFVHNDLETALDMVFVPMNISYTIDNSDKHRPTVILN